MGALKQSVHAFVRSESGATSLEFGVISGLIGACLIGAIKTTGTLLASLY